MQDKKGFLWFGTINGLNRFDGYRFRIYRHDHDDSTSIGSNFIRCMYEDKKGFLWVGTNKGIYIYNTHSEKFRPLPIAGLEEVSDIKEDKTGGIWLISNSNLFHYDPASDKIKPYKLDIRAARFPHLAISPDNTIWVSTTTALLKKYIPSSDHFITMRCIKDRREKKNLSRFRKFIP